MIISHRHKFIFLKTEKTAGTSIEIALSKYCGDKDVITPISLEDEQIRRQLGYPGPQNCYAPLRSYSFRDLRKLVLKNKRKLLFYNHISAYNVKKIIGEEIWSSYYKFCVERNPWDKIISHYYWCHKGDERPLICDFIKSDKVTNLQKIGYNTYTIDGEIAVDKICLFENLQEDLEQVRIKLGLSEQLYLPRAKSNYRKDKRNYRDILNPQEKDAIADIFSKEIGIFDYRF